jgi:hypothetical protein
MAVTRGGAGDVVDRMPAAACRCVPLRAAACRCVPLRAAACRCVPLRAADRPAGFRPACKRDTPRARLGDSLKAQPRRGQEQAQELLERGKRKENSEAIDDDSLRAVTRATQAKDN